MWYNQLKAIRRRKEESKMRKRIIAAVLMAVLACIMLVGCDRGDIAPEISESAYKAQCRQMDYKELCRHPDKYKGTKVTVKVRVAQIVDANIFGTRKAWRTYSDNSGYGFYDDEYYMLDKRVSNAVKVLTDDIVVVYGEFTGLETVTRALTGTTDELPRIEVRFADLAE